MTRPSSTKSSARRSLALTAAVLGALAAVAGRPTPSREARVDVADLAKDVTEERDHVTAVELARWIDDHKPGLRVVDVRTVAEFEAGHLPSAEWMALEALAMAQFQPAETIVLYSKGGAHAAQAWVLLRVRGYGRVFFLHGGFDAWEDEVAPGRPAAPAPSSPVVVRRGGC